MTTLASQFDSDTRKRTQAKIIKRNTFSRVENGETVIRLHNTDIVRKLADGSVVLQSGGYQTVTTKDRMNDHLPGGYCLWQARGRWYVGEPYSKDNSFPYFDGMNVPKDCRVDVRKASAAEKEHATTEKQIKAMLAKLDKLTCLPSPGAGDCFYCQMHTDKGESLGDAFKDRSHIAEHLKEGYLHGSLIFNALKWAGYRDPAFIWHLENQNRAKGEKTDFAKRALRRYLKRQMGVG